MAFGIETPEDELLFRAYTWHRDEVRHAMGRGVYPALQAALASYDMFDAALANGLADPDVLAYHASTMAAVAPYIVQLRQLAAGIVGIMQQIETAQPGAFGIQLPQEPEE